MNDLDLKIAFDIFKQIEPSIHENIQLYNPDLDNRFGHAVKFISKGKITAIWLDVPKINEYKLKILFKEHNKLQYNFFIQQIGNFYRIGWKI